MTKRDKLNRLAKASNALKAAAEALRQVADDPSDHYFLCPDARDIQIKIEELVSCDHDQGGLDPLIRIISRRLERSHAPV